MKTITSFSFSIIFLFCLQLKAQKKFKIVVTKDSSVNSKYLSIDYFDGAKQVSIKPLFLNNSQEITGEFSSQYCPITFSYTFPGKPPFSTVFFIDKRVANFRLISVENPDEPVKYFFTNAILVTDTSANKLYHELMSYKRKVAEPMNKLWLQHGGDVMANDSLRALMKTYLKQINEKTLLFIKKYPGEYFSLWVFRNQIVIPGTRIFNTDTSYLAHLDHFFKTVFPVKVKESVEGKLISSIFSSAIYPIAINSQAPNFTENTIYNKKVSLRDYRGKFILLDFWATWCPPCMESMPVLKKIDSIYATKNLIVLGINRDNDISSAKEKVKDLSLHWPHLYDVNETISRAYSVTAIPSFFLIDPSGKIIFMGHGLDDKEKLVSFLKKIMKPDRGD
jgi:thiol-disulfide isomerase/thioredoxin